MSEYFIVDGIKYKLENTNKNYQCSETVIIVDILKEGIINIPEYINCPNYINYNCNEDKCHCCKKLHINDIHFHENDNPIFHLSKDKNISYFNVNPKHRTMISINGIIYKNWISPINNKSYIYSLFAVPPQLKADSITLPFNLFSINLGIFNSNPYIKRIYINYDANQLYENYNMKYPNIYPDFTFISYLKEIIVNNNLLIKIKNNRLKLY